VDNFVFCKWSRQFIVCNSCLMYSHENKIYFTLVGGMIVLLILVIFFVVTILKYHRKKVAFNREKLEADFDLLDQERERIAADLHDDLGSFLSAIKLHLQRIKTRDEKSEAILKFSEAQLDKSVNTLRRIAFNMMPSVLKRKGLDEALTDLIDLMTDTTPIVVKYTYNTDPISHTKATYIYRIAQEILHNVVKHSKATRIVFTVTKIKDYVELRVADNGIGFDKKLFIKKSSGLGMRNIKARSEVLKAKISLATLPGKGTDYIIKIPLK
jgi:signal transduction histidine kinase